MNCRQAASSGEYGLTPFILTTAALLVNAVVEIMLREVSQFSALVRSQ